MLTLYITLFQDESGFKDIHTFYKYQDVVNLHNVKLRKTWINDRLIITVNTIAIQ